MGSDWGGYGEVVASSDTLTPNPSPRGRGEHISLSPWERAGVRVLDCGTFQMKEAEKLDAVICKNLGGVGYGE